MVELLRAAAQVESSLRALKLPFCFIGGVAVQRWAEPRATRDLDLSLLCGFGGEEAAIDALLERFVPRVAHARRFALENRVALLRTKTGVEVDVALVEAKEAPEILERLARVRAAHQRAQRRR
jgi:hypothetical protein